MRYFCFALLILVAVPTANAQIHGSWPLSTRTPLQVCDLGPDNGPCCKAPSGAEPALAAGMGYFQQCNDPNPPDSWHPEPLCVNDPSKPAGYYCRKAPGYCLEPCEKHGSEYLIEEDGDPVVPHRTCNACTAPIPGYRKTCYDKCDEPDILLPKCSWETFPDNSLDQSKSGYFPGTCEQYAAGGGVYATFLAGIRCSQYIKTPTDPDPAPVLVNRGCVQGFCGCQSCGNPMVLHHYTACSCPAGTTTCSSGNRCDSEVVCCPAGSSCIADGSASGGFTCSNTAASTREVFIRE